MTAMDKYKSPTPWKWRRIGDFALIAIPVIQSGIAGAPEGTFTLTQQYWIGFFISLIGIGVKFWTNTKKKNEIE